MTKKEYLDSLSKEERVKVENAIKSDFETCMEWSMTVIERDIAYLRDNMDPYTISPHNYKLYGRIVMKSKNLEKDYTNYRYNLGVIDEPYRD